MRSIAALAKKYRWPLTGALLGALVFVVLYGVRVLDPACVDWILNDPSPDPSQHYLGWVFYRRSAVRLPYIGANYSAVYPFRTSIVFTDSIPLLAVLGKLLGPLLPARFQYFGWWGLLCYALQGGLAQAILARLGGVRSGQRARCWATVAGAGVLVFFPALTVRMFAHTALAANWLVLLALWLLLRSDALLPSTGRACLAWGMMGLLCAGVHLYYLPMVGIVLVGYALRRGLQKRGAAAVAAPVLAYCGAALAELVLLGAFAANFAGYSNGYLNGADLANLLNEAALLAARKNQPFITLKDIQESVIKVIAGPEKKSRAQLEEDRRITAYHEAGHAVVSHALATQDPVHQITIVPRGQAAGMTINRPQEDKGHVSRQELCETLCTLLGGRAAEAHALGFVCTGAISDLQRASAIARDMVTKYGMSEKLGLVTFSSEHDEVFLGRSMAQAKPYSEETAALIDSEVKHLLDQAYEACQAILKRDSDKLELVARYLLAYETMDAATFQMVYDDPQALAQQIPTEEVENNG